MNLIEESIKEHIELSNSMLGLIPKIMIMSNNIHNTLKNNGKLYICGNGGSASDSQHMAAELTGRFNKDSKRGGLSAIALTTDTSAITAIANDFGFEFIFSRQIEALVTSDDILLVISTSGNSENLINAVYSAQDRGCQVLGLLGSNGGQLLDLCDFSIKILSDNTARIQEMHILVIHSICQYIDDLFKT